MESQQIKKSNVLLEQLRHDQNLEQPVTGKVETRLLQILETSNKHTMALDKLIPQLLASSSFSQLQVQKAIITLLEQDLIETVYTVSEGLGLTLSSKRPR